MSERELNVGASISTYTILGVPYYDFKAPILPIGALSAKPTPPIKCWGFGLRRALKAQSTQPYGCFASD